MKLDVPFLPETKYIQFLQEHEQMLYSVHYSLMQEDIPDGRHSTGTISIKELNRTLSQLVSVRKYALLNSRFHSPSTYLQPGNINRILDTLEILLTGGNIDGIVVVDFYMVQALSDASPEIAGQLEVVPGINTMLDTFERIQSWIDYITPTKFKTPSKINLDRSLNRNIEALEEIAACCCEKLPDIKICLLANEGCLMHCPFKLTHDAHIAYANIDTCANRTFELNNKLGCIRMLRDHPEEILRSPFIRPEDQKYYTPFADILKICGRTLGTNFLKKTIFAYISESYEGNLLALLDTQDWQVDNLILDNTGFSRDFLERLTACANKCRDCSYCKTLFDRISSYQPHPLKDFRNPEPAE